MGTATATARELRQIESGGKTPKDVWFYEYGSFYNV
jgi:hypothetical protein